MTPRRLLLLVALAAAAFAPQMLRHSMQPLQPGTYIVAVNDEVSVVVDVKETGAVDIDAPLGVHVILHYDGDNRPMDEFEVVLDDGTIRVDIDATADGSYRYDVTSSPALAAD